VLKEQTVHDALSHTSWGLNRTLIFEQRKIAMLKLTLLIVVLLFILCFPMGGLEILSGGYIRSYSSFSGPLLVHAVRKVWSQDGAIVDSRRSRFVRWPINFIAFLPALLFYLVTGLLKGVLHVVYAAWKQTRTAWFDPIVPVTPKKATVAFGENSRYVTDDGSVYKMVPGTPVPTSSGRQFEEDLIRSGTLIHGPTVQPSFD